MRVGNFFGWLVLLVVLGIAAYWGNRFYEVYNRGYKVGFVEGQKWARDGPGKGKHALSFSEPFKEYVDMRESKMSTKDYAHKLYKEGWDSGVHDGAQSVPH